MLHVLRLFTVIYQGLQDAEPEAEVTNLLEQTWQVIAELYFTTLQERKKASIPATVQDTSDVLFDKEDLK